MMLTKESNRYDEARLGYQLLDPHRPEVIFDVTSAAEVQEAVKHAADKGTRVSVQASGHGLTRGNNGGVLIATRNFNGVRVDAQQKTAWIEAGATWQQVIDATAPYGLAPLSGSFPGVGAISYTLGGGTGLMARRYGFAADHVRRIEVVTADGVRRNAEDDPELFWALRGGGGNFGVVTGMEVDLFDVPTLYGGSLYFDIAENPTILEVWREWTRTVPDEVTSAVGLVPFPDIPPVPAPLRGRHIAQIQLAILGENGADLIEPLRGEPVLDTVGELPYAQSGKIFAEPERPDSYRSRNVLLIDLDPDALATLPKQASRCIVGIRHLGGALSRPPSIPNAIGHRNASYSLTVLSAGNGDVTDLHRTVLGAWTAATIGRSLNFSFGPLTPDEVREAFDSADYRGLTELRDRYDANRLLAPNHEISGPR
ncbi:MULTISPECIES: FAD-binding oxidoreductase [unclassified Kribbella]|uniref:FAD-binding oxidoreductase n=1 Tax=unclassified Kribbella TaxID=2644121 RepID=UPI0030191370